MMKFDSNRIMDTFNRAKEITDTQARTSLLLALGYFSGQIDSGLAILDNPKLPPLERVEASANLDKAIYAFEELVRCMDYAETR